MKIETLCIYIYILFFDCPQWILYLLGMCFILLVFELILVNHTISFNRHFCIFSNTLAWRMVSRYIYIYVCVRVDMWMCGDIV